VAPTAVKSCWPQGKVQLRRLPLLQLRHEETSKKMRMVMVAGNSEWQATATVTTGVKISNATINRGSEAATAACGKQHSER